MSDPRFIGAAYELSGVGKTETLSVSKWPDRKRVCVSVAADNCYRPLAWCVDEAAARKLLALLDRLGRAVVLPIPAAEPGEPVSDPDELPAPLAGEEVAHDAP